MPKYAPEAFQNQARPAPKPSKIEARGIPGRKNAFKKRPKAAKKRPRAPNNCPRGTQEASKRGQEPAQSSRKAAKWHPRATLERFGALHNPARRAPRRGWSRIFVGSFVRHAPEAILYRFIRLRDKFAICENLRKHKKNCGFYASRVLSQ